MIQSDKVRAGWYRHFRGGEYRVLFLATWSEEDETPIAEGAEVQVWTGTDEDGSQVVNAELRDDAQDDVLLRGIWTGGTLPKRDGVVVVYCDAKGVYARTVEEFTGKVVACDLENCALHDGHARFTEVERR